MRLIDADAILAKYPDCRGLKQKLDDAPTVDPVVHGEMWAYGSGEFLICSICKDEFPIEHAEMYKYCPKCGAKMDGET